MSETPTYQSQPQAATANDLANPETIARFLGVKLEDLKNLKQLGLPAISLGNNKSIYFIPDVVAWILSRRKEK